MIYPITHEIYKSLIDDPADRTILIVTKEFIDLRKKIASSNYNGTTIIDSVDGTCYYIIKIGNGVEIPICIFRSTDGGFRKRSNMDLISGIYLEKKYLQYLESIKLCLRVPGDYCIGDWVVKQTSSTPTPYIHNTLERLNIALYYRDHSFYLNLSKYSEGDYEIATTNFPNGAVNFTLIDGKIHFPEMIPIPIDADIIIDKLAFISNIFKLNPTIVY